MPQTIHEAYRELVRVDADGTTRDVVGVITYGLFWADLEAWIAHRMTQGHERPTPADIDRHIQQNLTANYFRDLESKALQLFGEAALEFVQDRIEAEKEIAIRDSILTEVRAHNQAVLANVQKSSAFHRQAFLALITAIVAPLILGGAIVAARAYSTFLTPADVQRSIESPRPGPLGH